MIETITISRFKNYRKICEYLHEPIKTGKSKQLQLENWKRYFEYERDGNAFVITKVYDTVREKGQRTSNNRKNIQSMIDYLQAKFDLDDNWYSFTDWYCNKLELMYKGICNAMYHEDEIDAVCEEYNISDGKLFCEYISAVKSELKNMFLKSLAYLEKKSKITYHDEYKFIYRLGKRTIGYVITDCINDTIKEVETTVCNDLNEEYDLSKKMKGRQLLKIIYSKKRLTEEFKELCLLLLNDNDGVLDKLNCELSCQHTTFHPNYSSICGERPILDYRRGISVTDMELENGDIDALALDITNRIRTKVRKSLRKSYRKFMKQSDVEAVEKALFQHYDDKFDDGFLYLTEDDISDIEQIFGGNDNWGEPVSMENDFSIEEILDMPTEDEVQSEPIIANIDCVGQDEICKDESHGECNHGLFCIAEKDSDLIDIDDLY
ncbi:hypothetical protein FMM75_23930 [Lachnospiraceae bacterium MD335]|nr:hypothetical protein [Lachnospiraceae bacterium MD335]